MFLTWQRGFFMICGIIAALMILVFLHLYNFIALIDPTNRTANPSRGESNSSQTDLFQFFGDWSHLNRYYVCSEQEHACLEQGKLLYQGDGRCYSAGEQGPCEEPRLFHVDKQEASRLGGHMRGSCAAACQNETYFPVAATGECMTKEEVEEKICRNESYLRATLDVFGQWICEWTQFPCKRPERKTRKYSYRRTQYRGVCYVRALESQTTLSRGEDRLQPEDPPGDHPLLQFFADKSYLQREYPCSEEEKTCLQYGRVLHGRGVCHAVRDWLPDTDEVYYLDWQEANRQRGPRLRLTGRDPCDQFSRPQASTGKCIKELDMRRQVCRGEWGLKVEKDVFGRMVCECYDPEASRRPPRVPVPPPPASASGLCRAPDFSRDSPSLPHDETLRNGFRLPCSDEEFACLREGRVLVRGACHALRTQGPCAEGEEVVLDKHALAHADLQAVCKARPCPEGSVRLPSDGRCLSKEQVTRLLCPGNTLFLDAFGGWQCKFENDLVANLSTTVRYADGTCELPRRHSQPSDTPLSDPEAATVDSVTFVTEEETSTASYTTQNVQVIIV